MPTTVTGSPLAPFANALYVRLSGDVVLATLATGGVAASTAARSRTTRPYIVIGNRDLGDGAGAMQREGGKAEVQVDVFSDQNGPEEVHAIQARIRLLLQRVDVPVTGFVLYGGSLVCDDEQVFQDFDPDMPERAGFHGVQNWTGLLEEAN